VLLALALAVSVVTDLRSRLIYNWVTQPAMGDVKLIAVAGAVAGAAAGWPFALRVLTDIAIAGGLQVAAQWAYAAARKRERPKAVPYAVAIAGGTLAAWVLG